MRIAVTAALLAALAAGPALAQAQPQAKPAAPQAAKPAAKAPPAPAKPAKPSLAQLAAEGDAQAQYQLGLAHKSGKGARKNLAEAASWFAIAAGNGIAPAAVELARAYEQGAGVPRDLNSAAEWWFRAGKMGDQDARHRFLDLYLSGQSDGIGGPEGAAWLAEVAAQGEPKAILALGQAYETGAGVPADSAKARQWYLAGAHAGLAEAKYRLGRMLLAQPAAWRLIYKDPEQEKGNQERNRLYTDRATAVAEAGGDRFADIVRPGMIEGERWLRDAARDGHAEAQYLLGKSFLDGMDLPFSMGEAVRWLCAAALNGHPAAMLKVAELAASGHGFFAPDPVRAWVSYDLAAAQGVSAADEARDRIARTMNPRQLSRARQLAQDLRGN